MLDFLEDSALTRTRRVLISGSIAYDTIMVFDGHFKDHILPERTHMINVAFLTPRLKREFGGCASNIAYNLRALGGEAAILATVGHDGRAYVERLAGLGIDMGATQLLDEHFTAQAFITTDLSDNQITAFHPGAMSFAHRSRVGDALPGCYGIVGPNGKDAMLEHAQGFADAGVPFIFDPGQGLPMFDGAELERLIEMATAVTVNDYEAAMLTEKTGLDEVALAKRVAAMIVTRGGDGSVLYEGEARTEIPPVSIADAVDPTGCGDAFRGGLLYGLAEGWSWLRSARLGSVLGAIKIEHQGPQNHQLERAQVAQRYEQTYGESLW
ncbi:MAG: carbohydrate kinase family protein [Burkholderiaceae bacterium]